MEYKGYYTVGSFVIYMSAMHHISFSRSVLHRNRKSTYHIIRAARLKRCDGLAVRLRQLDTQTELCYRHLLESGGGDWSSSLA